MNIYSCLEGKDYLNWSANRIAFTKHIMAIDLRYSSKNMTMHLWYKYKLSTDTYIIYVMIKKRQKNYFVCASTQQNLIIIFVPQHFHKNVTVGSLKTVKNPIQKD